MYYRDYVGKIWRNSKIHDCQPILENYRHWLLSLLAHVTPSVVFSRFFRSFSLQFIFFSEEPFYGNYSTFDSHTNTAISHAFACSSRWRRKPWQGLYCFTVTFTVDLSRIHWHHAFIQVSHKIREFGNINLKQEHPARLSTLVSLQKHVSSDHMQTDILKFLRNSDIFPGNNYIFLAFTLSGLTYF